MNFCTPLQRHRPRVSIPKAGASPQSLQHWRENMKEASGIIALSPEDIIPQNRILTLEAPPDASPPLPDRGELAHPPKTPAGMGHNRPPEPLDPEPLDANDRTELSTALSVCLRRNRSRRLTGAKWP